MTYKEKKLRFRCFDTETGKMYYNIIEENGFADYHSNGVTYFNLIDCFNNNDIIINKFIWLKDKKLKDIYEGDIINENGLIKGNIYEDKKIYKKGNDIIVPEIYTKNWINIQKELIKRGCKYA